MKVHWVDGVEEEGEKKKTEQTTTKEKPQHNNKNPLNQTNHQNQSTTPESGEEDRCLGRKFKRGEMISG